LAVVASIENFAHYLYGRNVVVQTDHKQLVNLMTSKILNCRRQRFALKLQQGHMKIIYREGEANTNGTATQGRSGQGLIRRHHALSIWCARMIICRRRWKNWS